MINIWEFLSNLVESNHTMQLAKKNDIIVKYNVYFKF